MELLCHDRVWGWDGVTWVATDVFSIAIDSFWLCVVTVDDAMIGCGQGWEALCPDIEIVLQQARTSVHNRRVPVYTIDFLKFYVVIENPLSG